MNGDNMISNNHELFLFGNARFSCIMQGLSIKEIKPARTSKSFCSIEFIAPDRSTFTKSQRLYGSSRWHTRLLKIENRDTPQEALSYSAEADDALINTSDTFIRSFKSNITFHFRLIIPEYAKLLCCPPVSYAARHCKSIWIKIPYPNREEILQLTFCGMCSFNESNMTITVNQGGGTIIFAMGSIPTVIHKNAVKALHLITEQKLTEPQLLFKEENAGEIRNSLYALTTLLCANEGIVSGSNDPYIRMLPTYTAVKLFNLVGMNATAKAVASDSIRAFLSIKDCTALGYNKEPQYSTDVFSMTPSLLMLSALEAPNEPLLKTIIAFLTARCKLQSRTLINGMLPFEGREYYYNKICPVTDGSAVSTLFFIKSAELISKNINDKEIQDAYNKAYSSFRENFIDEGRVYLNSSKRSQSARFPLFIYGKCDFCDDDRFTWLTKNSAGAYCCDRCSDKFKSSPAPNLGILKESYLPVMWASYLDLNIFTADEISYAQQSALSSLDSIPLSDAALLLNSMLVHSHPSYQRVYDHLMSRRNSIGLWLNEDGSFDTLTNALCCYAIMRTRVI